MPMVPVTMSDIGREDIHVPHLRRAAARCRGTYTAHHAKRLNLTPVGALSCTPGRLHLQVRASHIRRQRKAAYRLFFFLFSATNPPATLTRRCSIAVTPPREARACH